MLIFWGCLFASCGRKTGNGWDLVLECDPAVSVVRNLGSHIEIPTFDYYSEKRKPRGKKKACQTKEKSDNICLFKITYNCLRERKPVQKALTCTVRRDYSVWDWLCQLRFRVSLDPGTKLRIHMKEKRFRKGLFCRESQNQAISS